ncbi:MAG TPA: homoserine dehydrogenase [Dehalococcoidia bacterium]|nr:homoserine dehydrogenase [Dehalococcoidia bacterium]
MGGRSQVNIVLLGLGVVGSGVARSLVEKADVFARRVGVPVVLRKVLVRDTTKRRAVNLDPVLITSDAEEALATDCDIVVEVMGGEQPAYDYMQRSLSDGRYVVTANKEVMAKHGPALLAAATEVGTDILYEASVGGGIPIISPLKRDLSANDITGLRAVINGTTNYILTRMSRDGMDFAAALQQAQALGYAEADPTNDIEGHDAVYKLAILSSLAFHTHVRPENIHREGITRLSARDFRYAAELGYAIKLLAIARRDASASDGVQVRVHPALVPESELLAKVDGVLNAVQVDGDLTGRVLFQGAGAGSLPTTSAVMGDVLDAARSIAQDGRPFPWRYTSDIPVRPMAELSSRYYIRVEVADKPGVLAGIARIFGDHEVSIASVIQKETDETAQTAELVIVSHAARESSVQESLASIERLNDVKQVANLIRVED